MLLIRQDDENVWFVTATSEDALNQTGWPVLQTAVSCSPSPDCLVLVQRAQEQQNDLRWCLEISVVDFSSSNSISTNYSWLPQMVNPLANYLPSDFYFFVLS